MTIAASYRWKELGFFVADAGVPNTNCEICFGNGWTCENHPKRAWSEKLGCQCGAAVPCECVSADGLEEPDTSQVRQLATSAARSSNYCIPIGAQ